MSSLFDIFTVHGFSNIALIVFTIFAIPLFFKLSLRQIVISEIAIISSFILYFRILIKTSEILNEFSISATIVVVSIICVFIVSCNIDKEMPSCLILFPLVFALLFLLSFGSTISYYKNGIWLHKMQEKIAQIEAGHVSYKILDNIPQRAWNESQYGDNTFGDEVIYVTEVMSYGKFKIDTIPASKITSVAPFKVIGKENLKNIDHKFTKHTGTNDKKINKGKDVYFICHVTINNSQKIVIMDIHDYTLVVRNILDFNRNPSTVYSDSSEIEKMIAEEKD